MIRDKKREDRGRRGERERGRQEGRETRYDREALALGCPRFQASFQPFSSMEDSGL